MLNKLKSLVLPKFGKEPLNELLLISKTKRLEALVMELGIVPVSPLLLQKSPSRLSTESPIVEGRLPKNQFVERSIDFNVDMLNIEDGMEPVKELLNKSTLSRLARLPSSSSIAPAHV